MANSDRPRGAEPYGPLLRSQPYKPGGTIYPGDFCKQKSDGTVEVATATDACIGVALTYATSSSAEVSLADDPNQLFVCQVAGAEVDAQTDIGLNCDILATAGNATYRRSNHEIDGSTQNTTATLVTKILAIEPRVDNALGAQVDVVIKINNHQLGSSTGTAGV